MKPGRVVTVRCNANDVKGTWDKGGNSILASLLSLPRNFRRFSAGNVRGLYRYRFGTALPKPLRVKIPDKRTA
jgi:hypothetical protein